jgi:acyl dehydratase
LELNSRRFRFRRPLPQEDFVFQFCGLARYEFPPLRTEHLEMNEMCDELMSFEELEVGAEWTSEPRVVTAEDVAMFADLTGDRNPVHLDPEFARNTPFRRCIAHGLLGLSLAGGLTTLAVPTRTVAFLGLREWHFRAPVYIGDAIRVTNRVLEKELQGRGRRGTIVWQVQVTNQDGRVVQEGVTVTLVEATRGARVRDRDAVQTA